MPYKTSTQELFRIIWPILLLIIHWLSRPLSPISLTRGRKFLRWDQNLHFQLQENEHFPSSSYTGQVSVLWSSGNHWCLILVLPIILVLMEHLIFFFPMLVSHQIIPVLVLKYLWMNSFTSLISFQSVFSILII